MAFAEWTKPTYYDYNLNDTAEFFGAVVGSVSESICVDCVDGLRGWVGSATKVSS